MKLLSIPMMFCFACVMGCGGKDEAKPGEGVTPDPTPDPVAKQDPTTLPGGGGGSAFHNVHYRDSELTDEGFSEWLGKQNRVGLIQLDFSGNKLTAASVAALNRADIGSVYTLKLSRNPIGDEGVELIAKHERSERLANLSLDHVGMTDRGARALAASPFVSSLMYLAVGGNDLTEAGIAALRKSPHLKDCVIDLE